MGAQTSKGALIDLGADVNAYRPGPTLETPLHHAAKRGLSRRSNLLLSPNPSVANDDCQTPLDLHARQSIILIFCFLFQNLWTGMSVIFFTAHPKTIIQLWKAKIEAPNFKQADPVLVIIENSSRARFKFLAERAGDKQQFSLFMMLVAPVLPSHAAASPSVSEDMELAMAINASIQTAIAEGIPPLLDVQPLPQLPNTNSWGSQDVASSSSSTVANGWVTEPANEEYNGWGAPRPAPSTKPVRAQEYQHSTPAVAPSAQEAPALSLPSAPPMGETTLDEGHVQYPSIDASPVDLKLPVVGGKPGLGEEKEGSDDSGSCVICLDAPVEGACIPCGHMAGCMSCLNEIKGKDWGCPVCRAHIDQVIKLYAV
ncbi:unnamed protein product [Spirodela intermedia]|uniref:RING-type domain-containing protein n=1 Tax=Spirodela intermedia TaxID=51605 RepID=A0A7I8IY30_SPIIN|nr:unnamed protein product [Spirodela intermedia]CAA6662483.1 unnamed protein product [Spirodela intermedia]